MEVTNILETKAYKLTDEEKTPIVKNWPGREGLLLIRTLINEEKEKWETVKGQYSVLSNKFKPP